MGVACGLAPADAVVMSALVSAAEPPRESTTRLRPLLWGTYGLSAVALLTYALLLVFRPAARDSVPLNGWGASAFEIFVSVLVFVRAATKGRDRIVPIALGAGMLMWAVGDLVLTFESRHGTPTSPSAADLFYLLFFPLAYLALLLMVRREALRLVPALWLDGAIAGLGAAAVCAAFAFRGVEHLAGGSAAAVATNFAYPVGDVLLLMLVVAGTVLLSGRQRRGAWFLIAAGCALNAAGDTFNLLNGAGAPALGSIVDAIAWPSSLLLLSIAVWLPEAEAEPLAETQTPGFLLPGLGAIGALLVLLFASVSGASSSAVALAAGTLLVTGVRLALTLGSLRTLTAESHQQAITDQLTGLGNRRRLSDVLSQCFSDGTCGGDYGLAFLFVDLDHFKEVNDSFGHAAGDELLRQIGPRIRRCLSERDLLARIGGDELVIILFSGGARHASEVAGRVSDAIREPFELEMVTVRIGASIGIAFPGAHAQDPRGLMRCADQAMYRAKHTGERYAVYDPAIDSRTDRLQLVDDLRSALRNEELELHYQPQIDLASGSMVAVEALLRWPHPRLGMVPPLDFLPLAEEAGLMRPLTAFVLQEALGQCADWRSRGHKLTMSINVSATNVLDVEFVSLVENELRRRRLPAEALILEITETTLIADLDRCGEVIDRLRALGCTVSIDDFGAGFTSIASLGKLAVGEVKLDRRFLTALDQDPQNVALVEATINLAHALGLHVVAEGVEQGETLKTLAGLGCDLAQGYFIARPTTAGDLPLGQSLVA
jgi:diguanylate cyclase